jgi:1-acyl-sn-glycerol-3-phosphate acyltransferase
MARVRGVFLLGFWFAAIAFIAPFVIFLTWITGNENFIYKPVRMFVRVGLWVTGVRVEVSGRENLEPGRTYVFTPNHQSVLEVPLFVTYLGRNPAYLAKKELFRYPVFGQGIRQIKVVPIDRSNSAAAVEGAKKATENLQKGKSYVVYPEGTRSPDGRLLGFKKGAFLMAVDAGVSVVPVTVSGGSSMMPKGRVELYPGTLRLTIHEPVSTAGYSRENVGELMEKVRASIVSGLNEEEIASGI